MAEIVFSPKQREVIDTRDKNILVSAAAGSGKTAVLVQRIIERILDECEEVNIDEILVLTYTEAAAGEMRERIEKAINAKMQEEPDNERIAKQAILIHNAQISTIHGFCLNLIRNNFTEIDLDPSFRVAETGEIKMVEGQIVDEMVEDLFTEASIADFELLADRFANRNSLDRLKETILDAYAICRNNPFVKDYIEERRRDYACDDTDNLFQSQWGKLLLEYSKESLRQAEELTNYNISYAQSGPYMYVSALESDLMLIERLKSCERYEDYYDILNNLAFERLSTKKDPSVLEETKKYSQDIRKEAKEILSSLAKDFYYLPKQSLLKMLDENRKIVDVLCDVLLEYDERLQLEKRRRKIIDFSDMEHFALDMLLRKSDGSYIPTQIAKDYRKAFKEIMVDEYQDSNHVQENILKALSSEEDGIYNRFMVGDVKQSIYSFRNACPELFMDKYASYCDCDGPNVRIDLSTNYRSRIEVLDSVNHIFERIMAKDLGGVDYDCDARLNLGAQYDNTGEDYSTELLLLNYDDEIDEKKQEQEARMVATRINKLVNSKEAFILSEGRKCEYRDIVVLLRSNKGWDDIYKSVFEQYGIPAFVASKTGYFSATEIKRLLNLLQVLDNPRNEIALFGVMTTFGDFSDDDLALIRAYSKKELYDTLRNISCKETDYIEKIPVVLQDKCIKFCNFIDKYRDKTVYTPINELLEEVIKETSYIYYVASMPFGEQRVANVYMLIEKAKQYESGSFKGLFHFIRYINEIQSYEIDYGEASTLDEQANVVRIMSIHKSKGLEFPVCFVCGMSKGFNTGDSKSELIFDRNHGIALDYVDINKNVKYSDLRHKLLARNVQKNMVAEEMRILYVAMTRAREKLYLTACVNNLDSRLDKAERNRAMSDDELLLSYYARAKSSSLLDFVINSIDISKDKYIKTTILSTEDLDSCELSNSVNRLHRKDNMRYEISEILDDTALKTESEQKLKNKITFKYLHDNLSNLYTKTSVSELKIAAIQKAFLNNEFEEASDERFSEHDETAYIPSFAGVEEKVKGTTRGTAYHRVMELIFTDNIAFLQTIDSGGLEINQENVTTVMEAMWNSGKINREDVELVNVNKIICFLESKLGSRMIKAALRGDLHTEEPFVLGISADRLNNSYPSNETVLIQGIIDAFFIEEGKVVLMDYKTDKVNNEDELVKKYRLQLDYYKEAIERITGYKVAEQLIYSFTFGKTIEL